MPEDNCVYKKSVCPMRHESWQKKVQKGISDSDELKYYLCVKCWLCKQEVAISVSTGISILFSFFFFCYYINNDRSQVH